MKRILCLALTLILSASAILATASCASQGGNGGDDTTVPVATVPDTADVTSEVITEDPNWSYDLPTLNYGGETVRFLVLGQSFAADEFKADDINGQLVNDAVYERNARIESELGVRFEIDLASSTDVYAVGTACAQASRPAHTTTTSSRCPAIRTPHTALKEISSIFSAWIISISTSITGRRASTKSCLTESASTSPRAPSRFR